MKNKKTIDHDAKIKEFVDDLNVRREFTGRFEGEVNMGREKSGIRTLKIKIMQEYARKHNLRWVRLEDVVGIWSSTTSEDVAKDSKESEDDSL